MTLEAQGLLRFQENSPPSPSPSIWLYKGVGEFWGCSVDPETAQDTPSHCPSMRPTLAAALLLAAATAAFVHPSQAIFAEMNPGDCCTEYYSKKPVPARLLASYHFTSSKCPLPAVIFVMKRNIQVCANPEARWTKDRIRRLPSNPHTPPAPAL